MPRKRKTVKPKFFIVSSHGDSAGPMTEKQARKDLLQWAKAAPEEPVYLVKLIAIAVSKPAVTVTE